MKCARLFAAAVLVSALIVSSLAHAESIRCEVTDDINATMGTPVPKYLVVKPMTVGGGFVMPSFVKFDLSPLKGLVADDVASAKFKFHAWDRTGAGPADTAHPTAYVNPVTGDPWLGGDIYAVTNVGHMNNLREAVAGDPWCDWTENDPIGWQDMPTDVLFDPPGTGVPHATYHHLGTHNWGEADITDIVKFWAGDDGDYSDACGISMWDRDDPDKGGYGTGDIILYFLSHNIDAAGHPGSDFVPYLEVAQVPEPGTLALLASGLAVIGLIAFRRRRSAG